MIDKLKNGAIIVLLLGVVGAFFYGKSQVPEPPPPPALSEEKKKEAENTNVASQALKAVSLKKTTNSSGNKKEGTYSKVTTEDFLFEAEDTVTISNQKFAEMELIIKNSVQPTWGLSLGVGKERDVPGIYYTAGYLHSIQTLGKNVYFLGDVGVKKIDTVYTVESGRASVIKLF